MRWTACGFRWSEAGDSTSVTMARCRVSTRRRPSRSKANRNVLVVAHGNSLRALVMMLDEMSESDIVELNIPTGVPLLYELNTHITPVSHRYLGNPEEIAARA